MTEYVFRFGKHAGRKISEVPRDYLQWRWRTNKHDARSLDKKAEERGFHLTGPQPGNTHLGDKNDLDIDIELAATLCDPRVNQPEPANVYTDEDGVRWILPGDVSTEKKPCQP